MRHRQKYVGGNEMFRKIFFCRFALIGLIGIFGFWFQAVQAGDRPIHIVSDVDDTLKMTNVSSYLGMASRLWFGTSTFAGMAELFEGLKKPETQLTYLSKSPTWMEDSIRNFLLKEHFPLGEFILSPWLRPCGWGNFKKNQLERIVLGLNEDETLKYKRDFVLFGDDADSDPDVYMKFKDSYRGTMGVRIYIHQVRGVPLPSEVFGYSTPYEIALHELELGQIEVADLLRVGGALLAQEDSNRIFPDYIPCPGQINLNIPGNIQNVDVTLMTELVENHLRNLCAKKSENSVIR